MRILFALFLLAALTACVPVGDPYAMVAAGNAAIVATQAEQSARGTQLAAMATQQQSAIMAQAIGTQSALDARERAIALQSTEIAQTIAVDSLHATQTQRPVNSTATAQYVATATQEAVDRLLEAKSTETWYSVLAGLKAVCTAAALIVGIGFIAIRWIVPAIDTVFDAWQQRRRVFEMGGTLFIFVEQLGRAATMPEAMQVTQAFLRSSVQPQYPREIPVNNWTDSRAALPATTEEVNRGTLHMFARDMLLAGDPSGNVVPSHGKMEAVNPRWGSARWQAVIRVLEDAGYVEAIPSVHTICKVGTLAELAELIIGPIPQRPETVEFQPAELPHSPTGKGKSKR